MGKKNRRNRRHQHTAGGANGDFVMKDFDNETCWRDAKFSAKINRRLKKKRKQEEKKRRKAESDFQEKEKHYNGWHLVSIKGAADMDKMLLFKEIGNYVEVPFHPLGYHTVAHTSHFYLEKSTAAASAIRGLDNRLKGLSGESLRIIVTRANMFDLVLNSDHLQIIREVMAKRFDTGSCVLDLTCLHSDPGLLEKNVLAPLVSPVVFRQIVRLIKENVPHIKGLNLSNNSLSNGDLGSLQSLQTGSSQLAAINLQHNNITDLRVLKFIKMFPLMELRLEFNEVQKHLKSPLDYIQAVRKELPCLKILDNVNIDTFLAEHNKASGDSQASSNAGTSSVSSSVTVNEQMLQTFLEQYYLLIDTTERMTLIQAYAPTAKLKVQSADKSFLSGTFEGQSNIGAALERFPMTKHEYSSFSLKILRVEPNVGEVEVTGKCHILGSTIPLNFKRTMTIIPYNTGLCCLYDTIEFS